MLTTNHHNHIRNYTHDNLLTNVQTHVSLIRRSLAPLLAAVLLLTSCGSGSGTDGILLIDEMAQIDFDIDYPVGQITSGVVVTQDFISNSDTIRQIWLYGATYMRDNTATVDVKLYAAGNGSEAGAGSDNADASGTADIDTPFDIDNSRLLTSWTIDSAEMEDNTIIKLDVPASEVNTALNGTRCLIEISSPDGEPDLSPTFWMTEEDVYPDGHLSINGYQQYNDIWFQVVGE